MKKQLSKTVPYAKIKPLGKGVKVSDPLSKSKEEYSDIIEKISNAESAVGIDAQLTHAMIIDYLQQLNKRIEKLEETIKNSNE